MAIHVDFSRMEGGDLCLDQVIVHRPMVAAVRPSLPEADKPYIFLRFSEGKGELDVYLSIGQAGQLNQQLTAALATQEAPGQEPG